MAEYISFQPSDSLALTGVGFQSDFTWIRNRTVSDFSVLTDAVRGATKYLISNDTTAETTNAESLKSFDSDGFTVGTMNEVNTNTEIYVGWNWKAGTTTGIAGSPSITPTGYSFNATSGFSVIAYTGNSSAGATLPHGLGVAPKMILIKRLDSTNAWNVYHYGVDATAPEDYYMVLNTVAARVDSTTSWNDTAPTSTLFSLGTSNSVNSNTNTYIAYCFADIQGYSKFGSYIGNGNANGPCIYTGFRPAWLMIKSAAGRLWNIFDNKRPGYNDVNSQIGANNTDVESTDARIDILSNGFKVIAYSNAFNEDGEVYTYSAFAEFPIVSSNDTPTTAR